MMGSPEDPTGLLPELLLLGGAVFGLALGLFLPRRRQWIVTFLAALVLLAAGVTAALDLTRAPRTVFEGTYAIDTPTGVVRLVVVASTLLVLCLSARSIRGTRRETEHVVLLLLGALGAIVLAGANDLMLLVPAFLLASIPLYALVGSAKTAAGTEAALKYYLLGAFLGILMLVGVTLLFGVGGATGYAELARGLAGAPRAPIAVGLVGVLAGLAFKAGAVPAHYWVPDATEGAPTPVAAFITTVPKIGGLVAVYRLLVRVVPEAAVDWRLIVAIIAAASMTLGNLAAFRQENPKRLLAYSTISQIGYLLMPVAVGGRSELAQRGLLFYAAAYAVTNLAAFAVVAEVPGARRLEDYAGLFRRHPGLALALTVALLGLIGTPPTAVFVGKLTVFTAAIDGGYTWLTVLAIINTVASVFYYLRWIAPMFTREPAPGSVPLGLAGRWNLAAVYLAATASVALGVFAGPALSLAGRALI